MQIRFLRRTTSRSAHPEEAWMPRNYSHLMTDAWKCKNCPGRVQPKNRAEPPGYFSNCCQVCSIANATWVELEGHVVSCTGFQNGQATVCRRHQEGYPSPGGAGDICPGRVGAPEVRGGGGHEHNELDGLKLNLAHEVSEGYLRWMRQTL